MRSPLGVSSILFVPLFVTLAAGAETSPLLGSARMANAREQNKESVRPPARPSVGPVRFITLAPGHFHAALVQKQALQNVDPVVHVYAPLGFDLTEHLKRIVGFNARAEAPTNWQLEVHATGDFLERFQKEKPGNVVVISGRNAAKIDLIEAAIDAGLHVLVDKPWIIEAGAFGQLQRVLGKAQAKGLVAYDIMTERFEPTNALQRALVNDESVFGRIDPGTAEDPGVYIENVHHFMKVVAGRPNIRPTWFFDSREQGEGMADTGTHLVDLVQWTLAPEQALDHERDVEMVSAVRWPTQISLRDFQAVTGTDGPFPGSLNGSVRDGKLEVYANTQATYRLRGTHVKMASMWNWKARPGAGDWHYAVYRGTRASVEVRQGIHQKFLPELYVVPRKAAERGAVGEALAVLVTKLANSFPGITMKPEGPAFRVLIPAALRTGHEAHFSEVTADFLGFLANRGTMPPWETSNMLAKYWVTTRATDLSRNVPAVGGIRLKAPR
ncbi:MAG: hypothetical protein KA712_23390 [Myxococcales bacterium]|nr:hypothetical protein [Myxococcales bacterium]